MLKRDILLKNPVRSLILMLIINLLLIIFVFPTPEGHTLLFYKICLVSLGAIIGYIADRELFSNSRSIDWSDAIEEQKIIVANQVDPILKRMETDILIALIYSFVGLSVRRVMVMGIFVSGITLAL